MLIFDSLLAAVVSTVSMLLWAYTWVVIISALLTWVRPDPYNPIVQVLRNLTEPVYNFIRARIPTNIGGLDIAPIIVLIVLQFLIVFLNNLLIGGLR
ncbi:MAG: YggT family protein [Helicobacter sp.]|nr:YggT family protein [Helicobacter sp.]MDE7217781.1 YggT family protein [Helicobacter sp.]MDE7255477.1 YggT family protein [Helicobacter sp.]